MSNYRQYNDLFAFHPGYYIKEIVDESGLSQEDFAKRLGTTPKNFSLLIRGKQSLSIDIATKLSRMLGTSEEFWLALQKAFDEKIAAIASEEELKREREVFGLMDYKYFVDHFDFPDLQRKINEQIKCVRKFLGLSSLVLLKEDDLAIRFRSYCKELSEKNVVNANVMVQIAINQAINIETEKFNKRKFERAVKFALTQTKNHESFLPLVTEEFRKAGVVLVVLPNAKNSGINGATKKLEGKVVLMVNDRRHYADTFWFSLMHECGHILNGDWGFSIDGDEEDEADSYAKDALVPKEKYEEFISQNSVFNKNNIIEFADSIDRDPGIVLGRLQNDGLVPHTNTHLSNALRHRYNVLIS